MHIPFSDKPVKFYNLDAVISVGYRVNSRRATQFRIWATQVLRGHLVKGYTLNAKRLREQTERLADLQKALAFIRSKVKRPELAGQADELLSVIQDYTTSLTLLHQYDQGLLALQHKKKSAFKLTYETGRTLIVETKQKLMRKYVEIWNRSFNDGLPPDVALKINHNEGRLKHFYDELELRTDKLGQELLKV